MALTFIESFSLLLLYKKNLLRPWNFQSSIRNRATFLPRTHFLAYSEENQPGQAIQELTITRVFVSGQATTRRMFHSAVRYLPFPRKHRASSRVSIRIRSLASVAVPTFLSSKLIKI